MNSAKKLEVIAKTSGIYAARYRRSAKKQMRKSVLLGSACAFAEQDRLDFGIRRLPEMKNPFQK
ncbi:MAG: hypothetical protein ABJM43_20515 [Paracoccaceae bacterium]